MIVRTITDKTSHILLILIDSERAFDSIVERLHAKF